MSVSVDTLKMARICLEAAQDKKALDPVILDLREISSLADYFVICSAQSEPQIKAVANGVRIAMKEEMEMLPLATDGFPASQWIVVDYGDVLMHIFHQDRRAHYGLEQLWSDAPRVE